ncbi:hypothetical protein GPECTOR_68g381 [Gonium pectorale]|uniref:Hexosyltransferase n=1 Tax=Gonium pectorale TaxID=33097 RepID=A0A150G3F3_GONPE|nr:hypothetical protein GPECTOR_68g381 [Gonium pectorale]|eukprot:KXZ44409.1 hypothetical protein GPECTOR_68g381 [Gonium pectorale]
MMIQCIALVWLVAPLSLWRVEAAPGNYTRDDLAVSFPTHVGNVALIEASRAWRRGLRTHVVIGGGIDVEALRITGGPQGESYTQLPRFPGHPVVIGHALAPLFALEAIRDFKWLLLGDDDTICKCRVPPAVLQLINEAGLNADDPHLLHDFLFYCSNPSKIDDCSGPIDVDRRCLPCPAGAKSCPCRLPPGCTQPDNWAFHNCSQRARVVVYGGVGVIYSVGLLRKMAADPSFYFSLVFRDVVPSEPWAVLVTSPMAP